MRLSFLKCLFERYCNSMMCREVISNHNNTTIYNCEDGYDDKNLDLGIWIAIGIIITIVFFIILLFVLRCHFRGPLKGSNNPAMLNDKIVVITGNHLILCLPMTIFKCISLNKLQISNLDIFMFRL